MAKTRTRSRKSPPRGGPMALTASSGYAIHGLSYLAFKGPDSVTFLSEISEYFSIPASYLAKVFQTLARSGLVVSYRGAHGGYQLARPGSEITLRDVVEVFEGPIRNDCPLAQGPCRHEASCGIYGRLHQAQRVYLDALEKHTVGGIAEEFKRFEAMSQLRKSVAGAARQ